MFYLLKVDYKPKSPCYEACRSSAAPALNPRPETLNPKPPKSDSVKGLGSLRLRASGYLGF